MARKPAYKRHFSKARLLLGLLTVLISLCALGQRTDADYAKPLPPSNSPKNRLGANQTDPTNLIFLPAVTYPAGGTDAFSVAAGDMNHDGNLDLAVAASSYAGGEGGPVGVLLGNGDGTFQQAVTYDSGGQSSLSVAVADVNGDGKLDLVVLDYSSDTVGVLLGNGDGTFQQAAVYGSGGAFPRSVAVADVNGDGKPDLLVANCGTNTCEEGLVGVLLGNGDGTFQTVVTYDSGGLWATVADVNSDGKLDVLVANAASGSVGVLLGKGDGTFVAPITYSSGGTGCPFSGLAVGDVNGDGRPDLAVTSCTSSGTGEIGILLGNGDGTFQPVVTYTTGGNGAQSVAVADVDGDDKPDLLVANSGSSLVGVLLGNGEGTFQAAVTYDSGVSFPKSVAVADVNADGRPDLLLAGNGAVSILLNNNGAPLTTTSLVSSANPAEIRRVVTYTATVTGPSGTIKGTVTFLEGSVTLAAIALSANQAAYSTSYARRGTHSITAKYSGELNHAAGSTSNTLTEYIQGTTRTVVTTSGSPSLVGQSVTFTATVKSPNGAIPNRELVTFSDGSIALASVPLANGTAIYITSTLSGRSHFITARYSGDLNFGPSTGGVSQLVNKYSTTTSLSSNPNPSNFGHGVTFTAHVRGTGPTAPTGKVMFLDGTKGMLEVVLRSGVARFTKSTLAIGTHQITAKYLSDSRNASSTSVTINQVVK